MEPSRLVHRLQAPTGGKENPYTFGVGLVHGGFKVEAMEQMRSVFEFAHMGSAQYEFGASQKAMAALWEDQEKLVAFELAVNVKGEKAEVYVICREEDKEEVSKRVKAWARYGGGSKQYPTREGVSLDRALNEALTGGLESYSTRGWLELDNGFFFGVDQQMAEGFATLLGMRKDVEAVGMEGV